MHQSNLGPKLSFAGWTGGKASEFASGVDLLSACDKTPTNILMVDDEPKNLTVLETVLDDPSYRLVRAASADEALLALLEQEFAVLILDIRMPEITGFELAQLIKQRKKTSHIPIIFLTAYYSEDQHVLEGYGTGAVDYLHKPVNAAILRSKVAVFAELHRKQREAEWANRSLTAEIEARVRAEEQLRELNNTLEQSVAERTASLRASEARLRAIYDGTSEYMGLLTPDGTLRDANRASLEFAGSKQEDVIGLPFWETIWFSNTPGAPEAVRAAVMRAAAGEQVHSELQLITPAGEAKTFDVAFRPICNELNDVILIVPTGLDITERKTSENHIRQLMNEVNHRSKNLLSVVQSIARQTAAASPQDFVSGFSERVHALAASHDLLVKSQWQGVVITDLIRAQLGHFGDLVDRRIEISGPAVRLSAAAAQVIGMVVHELSTNASKYGALSNPDGSVQIGWQIAKTGVEDRMSIRWAESGGPKVTVPKTCGFGTTVVKSMAEMSLDGHVELDFSPTGLMWSLSCPADKALDKCSRNNR